MCILYLRPERIPVSLTFAATHAKIAISYSAMLNVIKAAQLFGNTHGLVQKAQRESCQLFLLALAEISAAVVFKKKKKIQARFLSFSFQTSYPNYVFIRHMKELLKTQYVLQLQFGHFPAISCNFKSVLNTIMKIITNNDDRIHYLQKRQNTQSAKHIESKVKA